MTTITNRQHGLRADSGGFLVGQRRMEQTLQSVNSDTQEIVSLLKGMIQRHTRSESKYMRQRPVIEGSSRRTIDVGGSRARATREIGGVATTAAILGGGRATSDIKTVSDLVRSEGKKRNLIAEENARTKERNSKGQFTSGGEGKDATKTTGERIADSVKDGIKDIHVDTQGVDPTVDAINELGTLLSPIKKTMGLVLKPLGSLFGRGKDEEIPDEQRKHNKTELKLLRRIVGKKSEDSGIGKLAMLLPMLLAGITGLGATVLAGITAGLPVLAAALGGAVLAYLGKKTYDAIDSTEGGRNWLDSVGQGIAQTKINLGMGSEADYDAVKTSQANRDKGSGAAGEDGALPSTAMDTIRKFEGFQETAKWDVNAMRLGYGSDTITNEDGSFRKVRAGDTVDKAGAERDLTRRAAIFGKGARTAVGGKTWDSLPQSTQAALTSVAYNYGSLPDGVVKAAKTGNAANIAKSVRQLSGHNKGINKRRRNLEARMIETAVPTRSNAGDVPPSIPFTDASMPKSTKIGANPDIPTSRNFTDPSMPTVTPIARAKTTVAAVNPAKTSRVAPRLPSAAPSPPVRDKVNSTKSAPMMVQPPSDNIAQNVGDRDIAHTVTGGLGSHRYMA